MSEIKEKIDYVALIFRQIDRCNFHRGRSEYSGDVEQLIGLMLPFKDEDFSLKEKDLRDLFVKRISDLEDEIRRLEDARDIWDRESRNYRVLQRSLNSRRFLIDSKAYRLFELCLELLNRKGVIFERLRTSYE